MVLEVFQMVNSNFVSKHAVLSLYKIQRKVRAAKSVLLPNGKDLLLDTASAIENYRLRVRVER